MKKLTNCLSHIAFIFILFSTACKKDPAVKPGITTLPGGNGGTGGTGGGGTSSCAVTKADIENIAIFPADNPWNKDISNQAADPNSTQIIANFSTAGLKADFGSGLWENAPIG